MRFRDDGNSPKEGSWDEMFPEWTGIKNQVLVPVGLLVALLMGLYLANQ